MEVELTETGKVLAGYTWEELQRMYAAGMSDHEIAQLAAQEKQAEEDAEWDQIQADWADFSENLVQGMEEFDGYSDK